MSQSHRYSLASSCCAFALQMGSLPGTSQAHTTVDAAAASAAAAVAAASAAGLITIVPADGAMLDADGNVLPANKLCIACNTVRRATPRDFALVISFDSHRQLGLVAPFYHFF